MTKNLATVIFFKKNAKQGKTKLNCHATMDTTQKGKYEDKLF